MNTPEMPGRALQSGDGETRQEAARLLGSVRSERKAKTSRENGRKGGSHPVTEEMKARISASQKARWERLRAERGESVPPAPKRPRGRPRKQKDAEEGQA